MELPGTLRNVPGADATLDDGVEIERKFLVVDPEAQDFGDEGDLIMQGYLGVGEGGFEVRVRKRGPRAFLTIKKGEGRRRLEEEIEIEVARFDRLWPLTDGARLEKTRHRVELPDDLVAEVDVYHGTLQGLVTVEVEFAGDEAADAFQPPDWFGEEITGDPRYRNRDLARGGSYPVERG
jgi:adenylate cyclase